MLRGELGKLSACITTGWIIGPAIGSTIVSNYGLDAAPKVSAGIFAVNSLVGWIAVKDVPSPPPSTPPPSVAPRKSRKGKSSPPTHPHPTLRSRLLSLLPSPPPPSLLPPFCSLLLLRFVTSSTYTSSIPNYLSRRYGIPQDKLGYYSSYGSVISLVTNLGVLDRAINGARRVLKIKGAKDR